MLAKLANPRFLTDMRPLVPAEQAALLTDDSTRTSFRDVFTKFIELIPGAAWARTDEMKSRFEV